MAIPAYFDDIRCAEDAELSAGLNLISSQLDIEGLLLRLLTPEETRQVMDDLRSVKTIRDFQGKVIIRLFMMLLQKTQSSVEIFGLEHLNPQRPQLFITNHRDIILDSALLNCSLYNHQFPTTQIGIGNNLLVYPWIDRLVRLNKSFVVRRDGSLKEQLLISKHLSAYIRYVITQAHESVWLAQREGRAKDSSDRTQTSVLKMLDMSGEDSFSRNFEALRLSPVAFTYEYDPCDYLKAREMQLKRDNASYKKTKQDDLDNMKCGLFGHKGRISIVLAPCVHPDAAWDALSRHDKMEALAHRIDHAIHSSYSLFPNNYVAADLLHNTQKYLEHYTQADKQQFETYINSRLAMIDLPNKDEHFLRRCLYTMYANPALNQTEALKHAGC